MKIEQRGYAFCEASYYGSFVVVQVPVLVGGDVSEAGATMGYRLGSFTGLERKLLAQPGTQTNLTFRIPMELFLPRQRLILEVSEQDDRGARTVIWTQRYEAGWTGSTPTVDPVTDFLGDEPEFQL